MLSQLMFFGSVHVNPKRNYRRTARSKTDVLGKLLTLYTWRRNVDPLIGFPYLSLDFDEEELKTEMQRRENKLNETSSDPTQGYLHKAYQLLWCKDGKLVTPTIAATSCFSRATLYPQAVADRLSIIAGNDLKGFRPDDLKMIREQGMPEGFDHVPTIIMNFKAEAERLEFMVQENATKTEGNEAPSQEDNLLAASILFQNQRNEACMRRIFGATMGVKLYKICYLNLHFPSERIIERCISEANAPGHIAMSSLDHALLQKMTQRHSDIVSFRMKKDQDSAEELTEQEVRDYFNNPTRPTGAKGIDRDQWKTFSQQHNVILIRKVASAHLANKAEDITAMNCLADAYNNAEKNAMLAQALTEVIKERDAYKEECERLTAELDSLKVSKSSKASKSKSKSN